MPKTRTWEDGAAFRPQGTACAPLVSQADTNRKEDERESVQFYSRRERRKHTAADTRAAIAPPWLNPKTPFGDERAISVMMVWKMGVVANTPHSDLSQGRPVSTPGSRTFLGRLFSLGLTSTTLEPLQQDLWVSTGLQMLSPGR